MLVILTDLHYTYSALPVQAAAIMPASIRKVLAVYLEN